MVDFFYNLLSKQHMLFPLTLLETFQFATCRPGKLFGKLMTLYYLSLLLSLSIYLSVSSLPFSSPFFSSFFPKKSIIMKSKIYLIYLSKLFQVPNQSISITNFRILRYLLCILIFPKYSSCTILCY